MVQVERRKKQMCRIDKRTQLFLKVWPALIAISYINVAIMNTPILGSKKLDYAYNFLALVVGILALISVPLWKKPLLRYVMASLALGRAFSALAVALFASPPLPVNIVLRITSATGIAALIFFISVIEVPYIKNMSRYDD